MYHIDENPILTFKSVDTSNQNNMPRLKLSLLVIVLFSFCSIQAQEEDKEVIQFSGLVVTEGDDGDVIALPYVNIGVLGTSRGTNSDRDGYFSIVAREGEKVKFTSIGFKDVVYEVPDTLTKQLYFYVQIMSEDSLLLPEAIIYPWPDKDYFKYEFLAIDISDELREKAEENLANEVLDELRYTVPADGREATNLELRQTADNFKYIGQTKPQNIFNPIAWAKFIQAWRRGDYKKKKKDKDK